MSRRRLLSTRREIPLQDRDRYDLAWAALERAATALAAHAWRFRSSIYPSGYLEFLEFAAGSDPRDDPSVSGPLAALDEIAPGEVESWDEA